jgi:hypothetical protein
MARKPIFLGPIHKADSYLMLTAMLRIWSPAQISPNSHPTIGQQEQPEENKAVVQGSFFDFGRSSVNETDKTITTRIEVCSFPNWIGIERKSHYTVNGDEFDTTLSGSSVVEGTVHVVYKRAK